MKPTSFRTAVLETLALEGPRTANALALTLKCEPKQIQSAIHKIRNLYPQQKIRIIGYENHPKIPGPTYCVYVAEAGEDEPRQELPLARIATASPSKRYGYLSADERLVIPRELHPFRNGTSGGTYQGAELAYRQC